MSSKAWNDYMELVGKRPGEFRQNPALEIIFDEDIIREFEERSGRTIGVIYASRFNILVVDLVRDPAGNLFPFERIIPASTGCSVVTIPVLDGKFVLLEQFRHAMRSVQYAFPRGFGEDGLGAAENAAKELSEELGAEVIETIPLGNIVANSGLSGDRTRAVLCRISRADAAVGYEEIQGMVFLTPEEMRSWISEGKIDDGYTLAAWSLMS